ncbi:hypothetical protein IAD21_06249 [Abditibacteriota bacterium]|nr:hypothetical protein IAD21_06249 [Abditibacteriota bacterium]
MKLTPIGKLALFLMVLGIGFGAFRAYKSAGGKVSIPGMGGQTTPGTNTNRTSSPGGNNSGSGSPTVPSTVGENELQIVTSASKGSWINQQIDKFNATSDVKLVPKLVETREAMQQILAGRLKPALWSPSSVIWADRLSEVLEQKTGSSPLDTGDVNSYRSVLKSPMVFLTTKANARILRPLLASPQCWSNVEKLSTGKIDFPSSFKWAHADPLNANSGMLTLALIINDYANRTGQSGSIETVANSGAFLTYLKSVESKIVYNSAVQKGSSALVKSFSDDPSRYSFITAYESAAVDEVQSNPDLAVIYPNPTVNSESAVAFLNWPDLSPAQKAAGQAFLKFISQPASAQDGLKDHFRPLRGAGMDSDLTSLSANGFQPNYSAIELPPYAVLNGVAFKWRQEIARK